MALIGETGYSYDQDIELWGRAAEGLMDQERPDKTAYKPLTG
jgi:hypothetical protein